MLMNRNRYRRALSAVTFAAYRVADAWEVDDLARRVTALSHRRSA